MAIRALLLLIPAALPGAPCLQIDGERMLAGDLAPEVVLFAQVDRAKEIAIAPLPGVRRVLGPADLARLARGTGLAAHPGDFGGRVCVERRLREIPNAEVLEALRRAAEPGAAIEVLARAPGRVPPGSLEFPRSGLARSLDKEGARMWRGRVVYGRGRKYPYWVRARMEIARPVRVATRDLPAGHLLEAGDVADEIRVIPLPVSPGRSEAAAVTGARLRSAVSRGAPIRAAHVIWPKLVERGDRVTVEVRSGPARLRVEAVAESCGGQGDAVRLRNPENQRRFQATVVGRGRARVEAGPQEENP